MDIYVLKIYGYKIVGDYHQEELVIEDCEAFIFMDKEKAEETCNTLERQYNSNNQEWVERYINEHLHPCWMGWDALSFHLEKQKVVA